MLKPMLCKDDREAFCKYVHDNKLDVYESMKLDGVRCISVVNLIIGDISHYSRSGKPLPNFECFNEGLWKYAKQVHYLHPEAPTKIVFDSEVTSKDFQKVMQNLRRLKDADPSAFKMNLMDIASVRESFQERRMLLTKSLLGHYFPNIKQLYHRPIGFKLTPKVIESRLREALDMGYEGLVYKTADSLYTPGKSKDWLKVKDVNTLDLPVVSYKPGNGKYEGLVGALICLYNGINVAVSGFTDEQRREFTKRLPKLIEVKFQGVTPNGSLRHPRFVCVREDKEEHD